MDYFDEILNVYAYIKQKQTNNIQSMQNIIASLEQSESLLGEIETTSNDYLLRANNLAKKYGIDTIPLTSTYDTPNSNENSFNFEKIKIPDNYESEFDKLVIEAREAGFVNVHPEELLSADEMEHARKFDKELDLDFAKKTGLKGKDVFILCIAVVLQISRSIIIKYINKQNRFKQFPSDGMNIKNSIGNTSNKPNIQPDVISADTGVDMANILSAANNAAKQASDISSTFSSTKGKTQDTLNIRIKNYHQILADSIPFLINNETTAIKKEDILGIDKYLGWIFGVFNIMTDTITLKSLKSFSVRRSTPNTFPIVGQELSTIKDILYPMANYNGKMKKSVVSAVLREAYVLMPADISYDDMNKQLEQSISMTDKIELLTPEIKQVININIGKYMAEASAGGLINAIITTIHSTQYKPEIDGDLNLYLIRTNKILVYSNAIAASCNSIPAFFSEDASEIDWGGVLLTLLQSVNSIRFWINIKTEFIVSSHMKTISAELEKINKYFY